MSEAYAKTIAAAITAGEWEVNGETFKFNTGDAMIDGQHRCLGIVVAQKEVESFVTRGLNNCTFDTIDIGKKRTTGAIFAKYGELNSNCLAAAVAWLWRYKNDYVKGGRSANPRTRESVDLLAANEPLRDSVHATVQCRKLMTHSMAACLHYLFSEKDTPSADFFFSRLVSGDNITKSNHTSSILLLRNALAANNSSQAKFKAMYVWALTVKAWNAYKQKRVLKTLRYSPGKEDFPEIL
jgi:hypothetical protein